MGKEQILAYESPVVEVIEVEVEKGFATSPYNPTNEVGWEE